MDEKRMHELTDEALDGVAGGRSKEEAKNRLLEMERSIEDREVGGFSAGADAVSNFMKAQLQQNN